MSLPGSSTVQAPSRRGLIQRLGLFGGVLPYKRAWLSPDLLAGATLAAVAIPEGLGYARIAGMPPETGLYTCLLPVFFFAVFASTRRLVIGADSATAAISAAAVGAVAARNPDLYFSLSCILAIFSGVLLLFAGWLRLGFLSDFMSRSVLAGFLTGVGIQIAIGQLHGMLGVASVGSSTAQKLVSTIYNIPKTNVADLLLSLAVLAAILTLGKRAPQLPGPLIAVLGSIAVAFVLPLEDEYGVAMVGALPRGLPTIEVPSAPWDDIVAVAPYALALLLVQIAQSVSTASAFAVQHDDRHDPNRDLVGLGAANLASGLGSSFVVNGSPTKTAISDKAGTRSQLAMLVLSGLTIVVLLFLTGIFAYLPEATLSAVVFVIAVHLMKFSVLRMLHGLPSRSEFWIAVSTAAIVAFVGVGVGVLWAIVASIMVHLANTTHPRNTVLTVDPQGRRTEVPVSVGTQTRAGLIVYRFAANLYFANSGRLVEDIQVLLQSPPEPVALFALDGSEIQGLDWTSAEALRKAIQMVQATGARFVIARLPDQAREALDVFGINDLLGPQGHIDTIAHVLEQFPTPDEPAS